MPAPALMVKVNAGIANFVGRVVGQGISSRVSGQKLAAAQERIKPIERLVGLSCVRCRTSTCPLSTWWSTTALKGNLVLRGASRLDAFSGYLVRT